MSSGGGEGGGGGGEIVPASRIPSPLQRVEGVMYL